MDVVYVSTIIVLIVWHIVNIVLARAWRKTERERVCREIADGLIEANLYECISAAELTSVFQVVTKAEAALHLIDRDTSSLRVLSEKIGDASLT